MTIDLEKVVEAKAGKGRVPKFLINWGKKFIHQDFINEYLSKGYTGVDFCEGTIRQLGVDVHVEGMEHLDGFQDDTRFTFVSNHPLGGIDGVTLGMIFGRRYDGKIKYLVNDILMNIKGLAPMCVPVNVTGGQSRDLPALIDGAFNSENQIIMFPGKLCSRKIDGKIQDLPWGKAFINKSLQTGRYIVPVHFIGQNSFRTKCTRPGTAPSRSRWENPSRLSFSTRRKAPTSGRSGLERKSTASNTKQLWNP